MESVFDSRWNCYTCLIGNGRDENSLKIERDKKGCFNPVQLTYKKENFLIYKCLGNYTCDSVKMWIDCAVQFNKGVMPFKGGYMDQPAKVLELMNLINQLRDEKIREINEREAAKQNRKSKNR